jgi:hypothetical protein
MKKLILVVSHAFALGLRFALGIYALPILIAPSAPTSSQAASEASGAMYTGRFRRDLKDSDLLHWGEGTLSTIVCHGDVCDRKVVSRNGVSRPQSRDAAAPGGCSIGSFSTLAIAA